MLMLNIKLIRKIFFISCICTFLLNRTYSQQNTGNIKGHIEDYQNKPVPHVNITVLGTDKGTSSDESGYFFIKNILPGKYDIKFSHISYKTRLIKEIEVNPNQTVDIGNVRLRYKIYSSEEITITASKIEKNVYDVPNPVNLINEDQITKRNAKTSSEALREEPGVFVQKTNHGGGSAIIRGLSSNQILLLVDGIRLNNSTYRLGNHQYLTTVDYNCLDRIEIVRGPASVMYGSDALGGIINLITQRPSTKKMGDELDYNFRFYGRSASADDEKTARAEFSIYNKNIALLLGISYKNFGDLRRGPNSSHPEIENSTNGLYQSPSGFSQNDFDAKFFYKPDDNQELIFAFQMTRQKDVPRYDKYENNDYMTWIYTPQNRYLTYIAYKKQSLNKYINSINFTLSYHRQEEGREIQKKSYTDFRKEIDKVGTLGLNIILNSKYKRHNINYGIELYLDNVQSKRTITDAETKTTKRDNRGRYIDGSEYNSTGIFVQDEISISRKFTAVAGLRYSYFSTNFTFPNDSASGFSGKYEQNFKSFTGSTGLIYRLTPQVNLNLNISQGFRAPNLSDISKFGESKGSVYEVPNTNLKPEQMLSFDIGTKLKYNKLIADIFVYYSKISDLLASADALYKGSPTIEKGGEAYKVKTKKNIGNGFIQGFESYLSYEAGKGLFLYTNFTYTYGQNTTLDEPIDGIPPAFGLAGIKWNNQKYYLDFYTRFATKQDRLSSDDMDDPRIPDKGTPGWHTINLRTGMKFNQDLYIQLSLENILDYNYREHGSGINGPGRNFIITFEYKK